MRSLSLVRAGVAAALVALMPCIASAQVISGRTAPSSPAASPFDVTPYAGYIKFGDLLDGPLGTSLANAPAPIVGLQIGYRIAPRLSVVANIAGASSEITAGIPILGGVTVAETNTVLYDIGLELRSSESEAYGYRFVPFFQAGVGGMNYEISQSFINRSSSNLAANVGAGADIKVGTGMSIRLMARDYIGKFNFEEATTFDISGNTTNNYAVSVGLRFSF